MVRSLACEALLKAGVRRLPVRIKSVAEQFGISVFTYTQYADTVDCSVAEVAQRYGADGFTQCIGGRVAVFYYQNGNLRRIRWTIAHELAHVLLGHLQDGGGADADRQADAMAAELLCPSAVVTACGCTGPRELVQLCDISPAAAACRCGSLLHRTQSHCPPKWHCCGKWKAFFGRATEKNRCRRSFCRRCHG
ncbi:MAG: ImmA/IrrE family metallo-endopeptidase [Angelakisella sp.]